MAAVLAFTAMAFAAPANPRPYKVTQPWGEEITVRAHGDEYFRWTATLGTGYALVNEGKTWYFATEQDGRLVSTGIAYSAKTAAPANCKANYVPSKAVDEIVSRQRQQRAPKSFLKSPSSGGPRRAPFDPAKDTKVSGTRNILFIRAAFADEALLAEDYKDSVIFGTGKTVKQYYLDQSNNTLTLNGVEGGLISVDLTGTERPNHPGRALDEKQHKIEEVHKREVQLVQDVLVKSGINFAPYDKNNDGTITRDELCVYLIMAGYEGAYDETGDHSVWAHAWESWTTESDPAQTVTISGKKLAAWAMNGEKEKSNKRYSMVGTICHELGHQLLHLPDLYDTGYLNSGLGSYSLMSIGCHGTDTDGSSCPVNLDAWSRVRLGWATSDEKETSDTEQQLSFKPSKPIKITAPSARLKSEQYLLAELRDPNKGWDKGLSGLFGGAGKAGILVLHIDGERQDYIKENGVPYIWDINNTGITDDKEQKLDIHQGVMPICADNSLKYGEKCENAVGNTAMWYGENAKELTPNSTPNSDFYTDLKAMKPEQTSFISLLNISNSNAAEMTATLKQRPKTSGGGDGGSGGCNAGFGALALLLAVPLFRRKK